MARITTLLSKLNELGWVPRPLLNLDEWAVCKALVSDPSLQKGLPTEKLAVANLEPTQDRYDPAKVQELVKAGKVNGGLALERNGKQFIFDGHHRSRAAEQLGKSHVKFKLLRLSNAEGLDGMDVKSLADHLGVSHHDLLQSMDSDDRLHFEEKK